MNEHIIGQKEGEILDKKNELRRLELMEADKGKELNTKNSNKKMVKTQISEMEHTKEQKENELYDLKKNLKRLNREADILKDKLNVLMKEKQKNDMTRNLLKQEIRDLNETYDR